MKNGPDVFWVGESQAVIFPAKTRAFHWLFPADVSYWTPEPNEVIQHDKLVIDHLQIAAPRIHKKWTTYKRQYVGVWVDGEKLLFINFFCDNHGHKWMEHEISVKDGGDCYFSVQLNVKTGHCFNLHVNKEA